MVTLVNMAYGVEYKQEEFRPAPVYRSRLSVSRFAQWIIEHSGGNITSEKGANYVLIALAFLMIIVSVFLIFKTNEQELTPEEKLYIDAPSSNY